MNLLTGFVFCIIFAKNRSSAGIKKNYSIFDGYQVCYLDIL